MTPANWSAVRAFCAAGTQWRRTMDGRLAGLDYAGARSAAEGLGLSWPDVFPGVALLERGALDAQSQSQAQQRQR